MLTVKFDMAKELIPSQMNIDCEDVPDSSLCSAKPIDVQLRIVSPRSELETVAVHACGQFVRHVSGREKELN